MYLSARISKVCKRSPFLSLSICVVLAAPPAALPLSRLPTTRLVGPLSPRRGLPSGSTVAWTPTVLGQRSPTTELNMSTWERSTTWWQASHLQPCDEATRTFLQLPDPVCLQDLSCLSVALCQQSPTRTQPSRWRVFHKEAPRSLEKLLSKGRMVLSSLEN